MISRSLFRTFATTLTLLILFFAAGCSEKTASTEVADEHPSQPTTEIQWFDGTVEEALALAKEQRRPVFLYWGAVWCPPCHALRTKLFTNPEFVARLGATIPVYLDGDTERAQVWGEKLNTYGYPTVIVLDPDGNEITRIQGTLPVEEYGEVVSSAIESTRPIAEIVAAVEAGGPKAVPGAELTILAFYSFGQDQTLDLDLAHQRALFGRLGRETPDDLRVEKARFLALELSALADEDDTTPVADLSDARRSELTTALEALLADRMLRNTNLDLVLYGSADVVKLLSPEPGAERDALVAAWNRAARAVQDDQDLTTDDRLTALYPRLRLATLDVPTGEGDETRVPAAMQDEIRQGVKWASGVVTDEDELQAVMSTMAGLLEDAGLADEADALLSEKMSETTAPYYYQGWLASIKAEAGNVEEAVRLYRQAWLSAKSSSSASSMSAFRWGSSYLRQAMKYTPDDVDTIAADAETIIGDLLAGPDAFSGGNWSRLEGLDKAMRAWQADDPATRGEVLSKFGQQVAGSCDGFPNEGPDSAGARCRSFAA